VPAATLHPRHAGARRRRARQARGLRDACPRREPDGGHSASAPGAARPRGSRWAPPARRGRPDVSLAVGPRARRGRGAGAAGWAPASSGGVLANFLLRQVGVCAGADPCGVRCWAEKVDPLFPKDTSSAAEVASKRCIYMRIHTRMLIYIHSAAARTRATILPAARQSACEGASAAAEHGHTC